MSLLILGNGDFEKVENFRQMASRVFDMSEVGEDCFRPVSLLNGRQSQPIAAYGGLIVGQALAAAEKTVDGRLKPHSLHTFFILGVDSKRELFYNVKRVRDGTRFATRIVEGVQTGSVCFVLQCSFHLEESDSIVHQATMPKVPAPETLPSMRKVVPHLKRLVESGELKLEPSMLWRVTFYDSQIYSDENDLFEMRCTNLGNYYGFSSDLKPELFFWMRARGDLKAGDERLHRWLLAYISDSILTSATTGPHYSKGFYPSFSFSMDHCVWFHHAEIRADEWLLFECRSHVASGSRTLIEGRFWRRDGVLMASCQQEMLLRSKEGDVSKL